MVHQAGKIIAPMAQWRPLTKRTVSHTALATHIICLHTMAGTLEGSYSWSNRVGGTYWHFGLGCTGKLIQCQDLRYRSAANLSGNWRVIPIETADRETTCAGGSAPCGPWNKAQLNQIVRLVAWLCARFNIPPSLIPDTCLGRRGIAYHRQGIQERKSGCERWSTATSKACPCTERVVQLKNTVIPRVRAVLGQTPPPPPPDGGFLMALSDAQQKEVYEVAKSFNTRVDMLLQARLAEFFKGSNFVRIFDWMLGRTLNPKGVDLGSHDGHGRKRVKELINEVLDERAAAAPK